MRFFQNIRITKRITENFRIGYKKIWLYAKHDAGEYAR